MRPILFSIGSFPIYTYGLLIATAFVLAMALSLRLAPRYGLKKDLVWDLLFFIVLGAVVGARLLYILIEWKNIDWSFRSLFDLAVHSGGVFYGGFIGAILTSAWFLRRHRIPLFTVADLVAAPIALGQAIGRWGCFFAGCCWGKPTDLHWGITFTNELTGRLMGTPLHVRLHPTQIYESIYTAVLAVFLLIFQHRTRRRGETWWVYVFSYAVGRFVIEFFRGDPRGHFAWFSTSQWIAIFAAAASLYWWLRHRATAPVVQQQD